MSSPRPYCDMTGLSPICTEPWSQITWSGGGGSVPSTPVEPSRFSQWLEVGGGRGDVAPKNPPVTELHSDLDNILGKLQEMLASNFSLSGNDQETYDFYFFNIGFKICDKITN